MAARGDKAMITGTHAIIYSTSSEQDRVFFRDVLALPSVDVGGGWLIFGLPPAEIAVHPAEKNDMHEIYLMTDDIEAFSRDMKKRDLECSAVVDQRWGLLIQVTLPGGGKLGVYQPRHARPKAPRVVRTSRRKPAVKTPKKKTSSSQKKKKQKTSRR
jgi:hypothetical protein